MDIDVKEALRQKAAGMGITLNIPDPHAVSIKESPFMLIRNGKVVDISPEILKTILSMALDSQLDIKQDYGNNKRVINSINYLYSKWPELM